MNDHHNTPTDSEDRPECQLIGTDGNVFAIIGTVSRCLKRAGLRDRAAEWQERAVACDSYDAVLRLTFEHVDPC